MWFILPLLAAFLWATVNHIDKYLLTRFCKDGNIGSIVLISCLISIPVSILLFLLDPQSIRLSLVDSLTILLTGSLFSLSIIPYLYALDKDEASIVAPLFQLVPVFTFLFGFLILGETLTFMQGLGGVIISIGAVSLVIQDRTANKFALNIQVLALMICACLLVSLSVVLFKTVQNTIPFTQRLFWQHIGAFFTGVFLLISIKSYRIQLLHFLKVNTPSILLFNAGNELFTIVGNGFAYFAALIAPAALVFWIAEGFQPVFIFILGITLSALGIKKPETKIYLKIMSISFMIIGSYFLSFTS